MAISNLEDVLHHAMKDLLSAEKQFRDALPKLAEADEKLHALGQRWVQRAPMAA